MKETSREPKKTQGNKTEPPLASSVAKCKLITILNPEENLFVISTAKARRDEKENAMMKVWHGLRKVEGGMGEEGKEE